jgi:hypothetical protein
VYLSLCGGQSRKLGHALFFFFFFLLLIHFLKKHRKTRWKRIKQLLNCQQSSALFGVTVKIEIKERVRNSDKSYVRTTPETKSECRRWELECPPCRKIKEYLKFKWREDVLDDFFLCFDLFQNGWMSIWVAFFYQFFKSRDVIYLSSPSRKKENLTLVLIYHIGFFDWDSKISIYLRYFYAGENPCIPAFRHSQGILCFRNTGHLCNH